MVSIILPNLNTPLSFLKPRIDSIFTQIYDDWECIVIDGFSTNGSWEFILEKTKSDKRFFFYQNPAKGIYDAWNEGIKMAKGEYIYIATSDDLFDHGFLLEMVKVLNENPDCGLAHCCLNIIDEAGKLSAHQWHDWEKVKFYGDYIKKPHKRVAPYDAIVHFGWTTVYTSIVQLLIRKSLFEKIGDFSVQYGSIADFEWELRAALCTNIFHVPLYLASWRKHDQQATIDTYFSKPEFYGEIMVMAKAALKIIESHQGIMLANKSTLYFNYFFQQFNLTAKELKLQYIGKGFIKMPLLTIKLIVYRLFKIKFTTSDFLTAQLTKRDMDKLLIG